MADNRTSRFAIIAVAGSVFAVVFVLLVIPFLTTSAQQPENEQRRIVTFEPEYDPRSGQSVTHINYVKVGDMEPNSAGWFLDPFGKTMEGRSAIGFIPKPGMTLNGSEWNLNDKFEAFEIYTIIRLPELFRGAEDAVSSYRAYSIISITDHCLSRYWPQEGRWHIEDPCAGDIYRPWDGIAVGGPAAVGLSGGGIISVGQFSALASLDLDVDDEGYITAKRPAKGYTENGMPGEGKRLSFGELQESSGRMLAAASGSAGYQLPFPESISGKYYLSELRITSGVDLSGEWRYEMPQVIEGIYNYHPLSSSSGFEHIVVTTYLLQDFPELALNSPTMFRSALDPSASDLDLELEKLNMTSVNSLIPIYNFSPTDLVTEARTDFGIFSVFFAPVRVEPDDDQGATGALIWDTASDGKTDQLIVIRVWPPFDMSDLLEISRTLKVQ